MGPSLHWDDIRRAADRIVISHMTPPKHRNSTGHRNGLTASEDAFPLECPIIAVPDIETATASVSTPLGEVRQLPNTCYTDRDYHRQEAVF